MRPIDIRVSHDDDLVVANLRRIEFFTLPSTQGRNHCSNLFMPQNLVRLLEDPFHVEYLSLQRQDGLEVPVSPHLG